MLTSRLHRRPAPLAFDADQARDDHGRWTDEGGGAGAYKQSAEINKLSKYYLSIDDYLQYDRKTQKEISKSAKEEAARCQELIGQLQAQKDKLVREAEALPDPHVADKPRNDQINADFDAINADIDALEASAKHMHAISSMSWKMDAVEHLL